MKVLNNNAVMVKQDKHEKIVIDQKDKNNLVKRNKVEKIFVIFPKSFRCSVEIAAKI